MQADTVTITLKHYNELRDFKTEMMNNCCLKIKKVDYCNYSTQEYISNEHALDEIGKMNDRLAEKYNSLQKKYDKLERTASVGVNEIRQKSFIQLIKWYFQTREYNDPEA